MPYDPAKIEPRWQQYWEENETFKVTEDPSKEKYYVLDMFPYPSGAGLHVGHPKGYVATDVVARAKRAQGHNVLRVMGWDSFGLPAERQAVKEGKLTVAGEILSDGGIEAMRRVSPVTENTSPIMIEPKMNQTDGSKKSVKANSAGRMWNIT